MSAQPPDVNLAIDAVPGRTLPPMANMASMGAMAIGLAAFGYGMFVSEAGPLYTWGAYLVGLMYVFALSLGGVVFSVIQTGTLARWGRPLKRIAETFALFLPVAWVLLLIFLLGGLGIYSWNPSTIQPGGPVALAPHSAEAMAAKEWWLDPTIFVVRNLLVTAYLFGLSLYYIRASLRPDLIVASKRLGNRAPAWWSRLTADANDIHDEVESGQRTQSKLVPLLALSYMMGMSFLAFDLVMSLAPWWASNMFGAWISVSSFWTFCAALALTTSLAKDWLGLGPFVTKDTTHLLGKMMLAGCMFWAYTTYAQLLPIWYTDMPEETDFLLVRMSLPQWSWMSQTVAILCFLGPFTMLLSRGVKKMRWPFAGVAMVVLVGIFMERSLLVMPQVWHGDVFPTVDFLVISVGVWGGFIGLFVAVVGRLLASLPAMPVSDPQFEDHPWDVHVHGLDPQGHAQH